MIRRAGALMAIAVCCSAADKDLVCLPSAPSARTGSSVALKAWYAGPGKARLDWSVTTGTLRQDNGAETWDLKDARPGKAYADVNATVNGAKVASCSLEVLLIANEQQPTRETPANHGNERVAASALRFLSRGEQEADGFGLYSYILIGAPPGAAERDSYLAIFDALLRLMRPVDDLLSGLKPSQLNATCVPVKKKPEANADARWLLDNYDYAGGTIQLARAGIPRTATGVYIISVRQPLSRATPAPPFLTQDLSHVPASLASTWVALFMNQAAQERFWNSNTLDGMVAKLRLAIALTAEGVPAIQASMANWIRISK